MSPTSIAQQQQQQKPRALSRWTGNFLRLALLPVLLLGVPTWPILALSCVVPFLSLITVPLFILLSLLLLYSISWFTYLVLAQADAPSSHNGANRFLPFLPYSPSKCVKVTWATLIYSATALKLALPAALDWSYRRVMVLGTAAGSAVVKEGILYGSPSPGKRLDVYLPPARSSSHHRRQDTNTPTASMSRSTSVQDTHHGSRRTRKHSTLFGEPPPAVGPDGRSLDDNSTGDQTQNAPNRPHTGAPVVVILPSSIPPIPWTGKRKLYLQLALRLRRMGYCVVVPDITFFPEAKVRESIVDVRLVLRWVGDHISRYGGDPEKIHLMGHGLSAHLALLSLTQEAVVLSLQGVLELQAERDRRNAALEDQWRQEDEERQSHSADAHHTGSPPRPTKVAGQPSPSLDSGFDPQAAASTSSSSSAARLRSNRLRQRTSSADAWVDDPVAFDHAGDDEDEAAANQDAAPGMVMPATPIGSSAAARATRNLASELEQGGVSDAISFPSERERAKKSGSGNAPVDASLLDIPIPNGLRRVEIYGPEIEIPPIAGLILFSGLSDVIKAFRHESERGVEDLSILRRSSGPSHTSCLLHSPAHLLYASKNLLDPHLLPPKILLVHGGKDEVIPIEQSTLLKTLLVGIGVQHVRLRAYRKLGHVESLACLFLGMGKGFKKYLRMIAQDLEDFIES